MRYLSAALGVTLAVMAAMPLAAQDRDPTTKVAGKGLPAGWMVRFDPPRRGPAPTVADVNFRPMGKGLHINSGPAGIYYRPDQAQTGDFTVSATFAQAKSMQHESYGLIFGGHDLQSPEQNYVYMVIRPNTGEFLINHRSSDARPTNLVPFTKASAIHSDDPTSGAATNTLAITVQGNMVHFLINGTDVKTLAKSDLDGAMTDGLVGLRLNHNLDVHIANFGVTK